MPQFQRGVAAIQKSMNQNSSGGFKPFAPEIRWRDDGESKFIQIISPAEEIPMVTLHEWIPVGTHAKSGKTKYESFMSRKDPGIGENYDDLEDRLGSKPRVRGIGVALELEPVLETVKGRKRPVGFTVQTETFTRRSENGEETVTAPKVGLITQSSHLFWGWVASFEENNAPVVETPLQVTRRGKSTNTMYDFIAFEDKPVDFSNLLENVDGITYLNGMRDEVNASIASSESDLDSAVVIGRSILEHRLEELGDWDRYKELITPIQELNLRFGGTNKTATPAPAAPVAQVEAAPAEAASATKLDAFRKLQQRLDTE